MGTQQGEKEQSRRYYQQIIQAYGLYEDQALQDYVQMVGSKVAKNSHLPDWDFKFTVLDDESINAFTTGGGYVYVHRGLHGVHDIPKRSSPRCSAMRSAT